MPLTLTRTIGEAIVITLPDGRLVRLSIVDVLGRKVRIGVEADRDISVHRAEVQVVVNAALREGGGS